MTKTKTMILYKFSNEMKEDIKHWWKTNMPNCKMDKQIINLFKELVFHETIHYKIVKNNAESIDLVLELSEAEEGIIGFYYNASCRYTFPYKFNLPKYYPKFILVEFTAFLFDIICDIFSFSILRNLKYRLFKFLKCLIRFKVRS